MLPRPSPAANSCLDPAFCLGRLSCLFFSYKPISLPSQPSVPPVPPFRGTPQIPKDGTFGKITKNPGAQRRALCQPSLPASGCSEAGGLDGLSLGNGPPRRSCSSSSPRLLPTPPLRCFPLPVTLPSLSTGLPVASSFSSLTVSLFVTLRWRMCWYAGRMLGAGCEDFSLGCITF